MKSILLLLVLGAAAGCNAAEPPVLCTLENPETGERVQMFKELWFKVPADYDEAAHVAGWKAEQRSRGFTREVDEE